MLVEYLPENLKWNKKMSRYRRRSNYGYPEYVSVGERRAKAEKKIQQLKKKDSDISPVIINGTKIASSWWGISWNKNLESYADYSNRIGRGRSYVRHGSVLDLKIKEGEILSLVQGSTSRPYEVKISISKIKSSVWQKILSECRGQIDSLQNIVDGKLPKTMETLLTQPKSGMFPAPDEIDLNCSCPDSAYMCKHIAATLYGVGARLDYDPSLFFTLRGVKMKDLVSQAVKGEAETLLQRAKKKTSGRIISEADLSATFGIDMDLPSSPSPSPGKKRARSVPPPKPASPGTSTKRPRRKKAVPPSIPAQPATRAKKTTSPPANTKQKTVTDYDVVVGIIRRRRVKGMGFKEIKERTGIADTKIRNIIQQAKQKKVIQNISRGLYIKGPDK